MSDPTPSQTRASLEPIFSPRSVAVIGASRNRDSIGFALLHNLVMGEFQGAIFPINPHASSIHSLKAYPRIGDVPDPVDLAMVLVPRHLVLAVVDECIEAGVKGLVTITAGFAETGEEGAEMERRLRERVRAAGVRMVGPNCMGVINTAAGVSLNATFAPTPAQPGTIGLAASSSNHQGYVAMVEGDGPRTKKEHTATGGRHDRKTVRSTDEVSVKKGCQ